MNPQNPQVRYRKALCLMDLQRYKESLREFQETVQLAPKESHVYYKMGTVYKTLGRLEEALKSFLHSLDLDPKNAPMIRDAIDRLHQRDETMEPVYKTLV